MVLDDNGSRHSTVNRQAGLFSYARTSDGGFQGAVGTYYILPKMSKIMMMAPTTITQLGSVCYFAHSLSSGSNIKPIFFPSSDSGSSS